MSGKKFFLFAAGIIFLAALLSSFMISCDEFGRNNDNKNGGTERVLEKKVQEIAG